MHLLSAETKSLVEQLSYLKAKSPRLGKGKWQHQIVDLLQRVAEQKQPAAISMILRFLFLEPVAVRQQAAVTLHQLLAHLPSEALLRNECFYSNFRSWKAADAWDELLPAQVSDLVAELPHRTSVLGLISLHHNGYVRCNAVKLLAQSVGGDEVPYLLVRLNDWVRLISSDARAAVEARLNEAYLLHLTRHLPLLVQLLDATRNDLCWVFKSVVSMLVKPQHEAKLAELVHSSNRFVQRQIVAFALRIVGEHQTRIIKLGLTSGDSNIRYRCVKSLRLHADSNVAVDLLGRVDRDPYMPVRREGLRLQAEFQPHRRLAIWQRALLDAHRSIRELAHFEVDRIGRLDVAQFYRQALAESPRSLAALAGLTEVGDASDLPVLQRYLQDPLPRHRQSAVVGISRFAGEAAIPVLINCLNDGSPRVIREAIQQLHRQLAYTNGEQLLGIVHKSQRPDVRLAALRLLASMGKWRSLPWLIRATAHADANVQALAGELVAEWFSKCGTKYSLSRQLPSAQLYSELGRTLELQSIRISLTSYRLGWRT